MIFEYFRRKKIHKKYFKYKSNNLLFQYILTVRVPHTAAWRNDSHSYSPAVHSSRVDIDNTVIIII